MSGSRRVAILGSSGSIGRQALEVLADRSADYHVVGLAAGGRDPETLARDAVAVGAEVVAVADEQARPALLEALSRVVSGQSGQRPTPEVLAGPGAATELAAMECDVVLNGITGSVGLGPTLAALRAGRTLALANKESLVAGGPLVTRLAAPDQIVPVDSEHSALAQCLRGGRSDEVRRLVLTASGGPFRGRTRRDLENVTVAETLAHPTWSMGPVVTVNSATMVNKGLEVIEAHLLFGVPYRDIAVVVHPQSVIHSMVEFTDGSTLAQASPPDMRLPIALGLSWPKRLTSVTTPVDWTTSHTWTLEALDEQTFPAVGLARAAGEAGGLMPAVYNAANEVAVEAFLAERIPYLGIVAVVEQVLASSAAVASDEPRDIDDVWAAERAARERAEQAVLVAQR